MYLEIRILLKKLNMNIIVQNLEEMEIGQKEMIMKLIKKKLII